MGSSAEFDTTEIDQLHIELRATGDRAIRNRLVEMHSGLAVQCARRFRDRGEPLDDLTQVAMLGLVKAVDRFDPEMGSAFVSFAVPTITGELRRHFRDASWAVHVPRRTKDLSLQLNVSGERLRERFGRNPTIDEIAEDLRVTADDILDALEASSAYRTTSLTATRGESNSAARIDPGVEDRGLTQAEAAMTVERLLDTLPERERQILVMRFFEDKSQSEIAAAVGTSQVHVSRLIRASLGRLQAHLEPIPPTESTTTVPRP